MCKAFAVFLQLWGNDFRRKILKRCFKSCRGGYCWEAETSHMPSWSRFSASTRWAQPWGWIFGLNPKPWEEVTEIIYMRTTRTLLFGEPWCGVVTATDVDLSAMFEMLDLKGKCLWIYGALKAAMSPKDQIYLWDTMFNLIQVETFRREAFQYDTSHREHKSPFYCLFMYFIIYLLFLLVLKFKWSLNNGDVLIRERLFLRIYPGNSPWYLVSGNLSKLEQGT